jgi:hypothetical protein
MTTTTTPVRALNAWEVSHLRESIARDLKIAEELRGEAAPGDRLHWTGRTAAYTHVLRDLDRMCDGEPWAYDSAAR